MVKRCVAAGCSNTYSDGVSLFAFPRDPSLRQEWLKQVQKTRARWSGPSEHSVLCSCHFTEDCFEPDTLLAPKLGLAKRKMLKRDAVPTIFNRDASVARKRQATSSHEASTQATGDSEPRSKRRKEGAYEKRERARVWLTYSTI